MRVLLSSTLRGLCGLCMLHFAKAGNTGNTSVTACDAIASLLPNTVFFPGESAYGSSLTSYAYVQEQVQRPSCIVKPSSAVDVSCVLRVLGKSSTPFAFRSGGHATNQGFSNIDGGVTLDLTLLNNVAVLGDGITATIGTGASWADVYPVLDAHNRSVNGGRADGVGVGGFLSGGSYGGIGFFAPQYGFACDAVVNVEVVLASGDVINANWTSHPDLFIALKGGQSNFGVVTRWDITTISKGKFWGGNIIYNYSTNAEQLQAFTDWKTSENFDQLASVEQSHVYAGSADESTWLISSSLYYAEPVSNPHNMKNFTNIGSQLSNTIRISNASDFAYEVQAESTPNLYTIFATTTFRISPTILAAVEGLWQASVNEISKHAVITSSLTLQSIPAPPLDSSRTNSLGFVPASTPQKDLVLLLITNFWDDPKVGPLVENGTEVFVNSVINAAEKEGLAQDFVYENYAAAGFQKPLQSTGNMEMFREVALKYDPGQMFQRQAIGGWKLY